MRIIKCYWQLANSKFSSPGRQVVQNGCWRKVGSDFRLFIILLQKRESFFTRSMWLGSKVRMKFRRFWFKKGEDFLSTRGWGRASWANRTKNVQISGLSRNAPGNSAKSVGPDAEFITSVTSDLNESLVCHFTTGWAFAEACHDGANSGKQPVDVKSHLVNFGVYVTAVVWALVKACGENPFILVRNWACGAKFSEGTADCRSYRVCTWQVLDGLRPSTHTTGMRSVLCHAELRCWICFERVGESGRRLRFCDTELVTLFIRRDKKSNTVMRCSLENLWSLQSKWKFFSCLRSLFVSKLESVWLVRLGR